MANHDYMSSYPYLWHLISGWFHQDFDIVGDTLEELLSDYRSSTMPFDAAGLRADIQRLIHFQGDRLDAAFIELFGNEIEFAGWGLSTREWLERIDSLLSE